MVVVTILERLTSLQDNPYQATEIQKLDMYMDSSSRNLALIDSTKSVENRLVIE